MERDRYRPRMLNERDESLWDGFVKVVSPVYDMVDNFIFYIKFSWQYRKDKKAGKVKTKEELIKEIDENYEKFLKNEPIDEVKSDNSVVDGCNESEMQ